MLRATVLLLALWLLTGCGLFDKQNVPIEPAVALGWENKIGPLQEHREEWRSAAESYVGLPVADVVALKDEAGKVHIYAVIGSPVDLFIGGVVDGVLDGIEENPKTSVGVGAAALAAILLGVSRVRKGRRLARGSPKPPPNPAPVVG